jgi:peptide/nickel transport system substrate-binding protein
MRTSPRPGRERRTASSGWAKWLSGLAVIGLIVSACGTTAQTPSPAASAAATQAPTAAPATATPAASATAAATAAATASPTAAATATATATAVATATATLAATAATGEVPRNETLIYGQGVSTSLRAVNNFNPLFQQASNPVQGDYGIYEQLFYTNLNTGELIPWQAESYEQNPEGTQITLHLRKGVTWCDGEPFTADDVKFTWDTLKTGDPALAASANYKEHIKDVTVVDPQTVSLTLNAPAPRWFKNTFTLGHDSSLYAIVPKHLFEGQDPKTFTFYDLAKAWPCGTGPYKITSSSPDKLVLDLRDKWWGTETGFSKAPAPKRVIWIPVATDQACADLYAHNEVDLCGDLEPGLFVATKNSNPEVRSWAKEGPVWGAPDGCDFVFAFNTTTAPYNDVNVRLAFNYAIDRQQISDLAYDGSNHPEIIPFSSYMSAQWQPGRVQELMDKFDRGTPSQAKVDEYMGKAGFAKNADGFWAKDGKVLDANFIYLTFMAPIGPILEQQLKAAGFNATAKLDDKWDATVFPGKQALWTLVHCGSLTDPFEAYTPYHPKYAVANGTNCTLFMGCSRWKNEEMGQLLDKMATVAADPAQDSQYMDWVVRATEIYLTEMPEINLTEEYHVITYDEHYWTGFPTQEDPYIAPYYCCWPASDLIYYHLKPTGAQ